MNERRGAKLSAAFFSLCGSVCCARQVQAAATSTAIAKSIGLMRQLLGHHGVRRGAEYEDGDLDLADLAQLLAGVPVH